MDYKQYIANIQDFPTKGILFRDITPLMQNGDVFSHVIETMSNIVANLNATVIVGPEARGFIFGCPVAFKLKIGFVPVRKPGKLPRDVVFMSYDLEYGSNTLAVHADAIKPGDNVVIIDDLLATGGTVFATCKLVEKLGGKVAGIITLIELKELHGRNTLKDYFIYSLIKY